MNRPRVLLDVDGVLADFVGPALAWFNADQGTSFEPHHVTEYSIEKSLGLTKQQADRFYKLCSRLPVGDQPVFVGAIEGFTRLSEVADVHIVTAPWLGHATWAYERIDWLWRHFQVPYKRVVITPAKHLVRGDFLVDDKTETLHTWAAEHPNSFAVQWQTPHNRLDSWAGLSTNDWDWLVETVASGVPDPGINLLCKQCGSVRAGLDELAQHGGGK